MTLVDTPFTSRSGYEGSHPPRLISPLPSFIPGRRLQNLSKAHAFFGAMGTVDTCSINMQHSGISSSTYHSIQGGAPQVISWFIITLTIDISTTSPSEIRLMFTNLAILGAPPCSDTNRPSMLQNAWGCSWGHPAAMFPTPW